MSKGPRFSRAFRSDRSSISLGAEGQELDASMATYMPEEGTIIPPEVMMVLTPKSGNKQRAYTCSITLLAPLDNPELIKGRMVACIDGVKLLIKASKEAK